MYIRLFKDKNLVHIYQSEVILRVGEFVRPVHEEKAFKVLSVEHVIAEKEIDAVNISIE